MRMLMSIKHFSNYDNLLFHVKWWDGVIERHHGHMRAKEGARERRRDGSMPK